MDDPHDGTMLKNNEKYTQQVKQRVFTAVLAAPLGELLTKHRQLLSMKHEFPEMKGYFPSSDPEPCTLF